MGLSEIVQRLADFISTSSFKIVQTFSWLGLFISGLTFQQITGGTVALCSAVSIIVALIMDYRLKSRLIRIADTKLSTTENQQHFLDQTHE